MRGHRPARIVSVRAYGACQPISGRWFYLLDLGGPSVRWLHNPFTTAAAALAWAEDSGYHVVTATASLAAGVGAAVSGRG